MLGEVAEGGRQRRRRPFVERSEVEFHGREEEEEEAVSSLKKIELFGQKQKQKQKQKVCVWFPGEFLVCHL